MNNLQNLAKNIESYYDFLQNSGLVPHIIILNEGETQLPPSLKDQKMVLLNVSHNSINYFHIDEKGISVEMRFNSQAFTVFTPLSNVICLKSKNDFSVLNIKGLYDEITSNVKTLHTQNVDVNNNNEESKVKPNTVGKFVPKLVSVSKANPVDTKKSTPTEKAKLTLV
jgi:stringent starvation protein B